MGDETNRLILAELRTLNARLDRIVPGIEGIVRPFMWQTGRQAIEQLIAIQTTPTSLHQRAEQQEDPERGTPKLSTHCRGTQVDRVYSRLRHLVRRALRVQSDQEFGSEQAEFVGKQFYEQTSNSSNVMENKIGDSVAADPRNDATPDTSAKGVRDDG
ncbi:hypothetical protein [Gluconobacter sp. Dm-44]|uniref:hypothetical protein n=1 Tax=Gluconobacter sp. Dm-44 TaxID=2799805 RepID=UPI001B8BA94D|nr:hypothetical protein [Gluconobacter sp. Dm-44]MBS1060742.1 hypothetical protein [Gluconobacter sp. Dm-44]